MADVEHNSLGGTANQHAIHWGTPVADEAERFALTPTSADLGKVIWQEDNNTFWALIDDTEADNSDGWQELDGVTALAAAVAAQADATQALADAATALTAANEADDTADAAQSTANTHASRHLSGGADAVQPFAAGANLTDADATIQWSSTDSYRRLPAGTLSTDRTLTLGVTNVIANGGSGWVLDIEAQGAGNDLIIANGGAGGGTIDTIAGGVKCFYYVRHDGTNWTRGFRVSKA